jgi:hypothetical protein
MSRIHSFFAVVDALDGRAIRVANDLQCRDTGALDQRDDGTTRLDQRKVVAPPLERDAATSIPVVCCADQRLPGI